MAAFKTANDTINAALDTAIEGANQAPNYKIKYPICAAFGAALCTLVNPFYIAILAISDHVLGSIEDVL